MKAITGAARTTRTAGALASDYQGPDGASLVAGSAVLVPRDGGDLRAKARQAAAQGAAAMLVYGTSELPAGALGGDDRVGIPALAIDGALGLRLAQAVAAGQAVTLTAGTATYAPNALRDAVAPFSSEGLGWDDRLKPDVVLPGVAIIGAEAGGGYAAVSGTSVAAAQAAGPGRRARRTAPRLERRAPAVGVRLDRPSWCAGWTRRWHPCRRRAAGARTPPPRRW